LNPNANILAVAADCSIETSVEEAIAKTVDRFGRLDVCFNAAGIAGEYRGMVEQSTENLDKVLGLNLRGLWFCERAQIKQMMKQELRPVR
jgi:NAD(P)-dependent dehydrogenase (short-subunit alcohol dehydrogenase family)